MQIFANFLFPGEYKLIIPIQKYEMSIFLKKKQII